MRTYVPETQQNLAALYRRRDFIRNQMILLIAGKQVESQEKYLLHGYTSKIERTSGCTSQNETTTGKVVLRDV